MKNEKFKNFNKIIGCTALLVMFLALMGVGCRGKTPPVFFYTLSPMPASVSLPDSRTGNTISVGVGPVSLPDFLNNPRIATRSEGPKIHYSEFHRWGGYIDKDLLRVVTENLSAQLATEHVQPYPWSEKFRPVYQVTLDIRQFDGDPEGDVTLNVVWRLSETDRTDGPSVLKRSVIREPVNASAAGDYEALVTAHSRTLARLSAKIAEAILNF